MENEMKTLGPFPYKLGILVFLDSKVLHVSVSTAPEFQRAGQGASASERNGHILKPQALDSQTPHPKPPKP